MPPSVGTHSYAAKSFHHTSAKLRPCLSYTDDLEASFVIDVYDTLNFYESRKRGQDLVLASGGRVGFAALGGGSAGFDCDLQHVAVQFCEYLLLCMAL